MSSKYTFMWKDVVNTVSDRLLDDSLLHTLNTNKKINKRTKTINRELKKLRNNVRTYKHFLSVKKKVERTCQDGDETDDEPGLDYDAYQKLHNKKRHTGLQNFLRSCTLRKKNEVPQETERISRAINSEKPNKSRTVQRPNRTAISKTKSRKYLTKSTGKTSISHSDNSQSKSSETESSKTTDTDNVTRRNIHRDGNVNEKNHIREIVEDLISSNVKKKVVGKSLESNSVQAELATFDDTEIVKNLTETLAANEPQYVTDITKNCFVLDNDREVLNHEKQETCNVIVDSEDNLNASSAVINCREISHKDNLFSQEDMSMTNDENFSSEENLSHENNNDKYIDALNCDSGNNTLSDTDFLRDIIYGKSSVDKDIASDYHGKEIGAEHCFSITEKNNIILHDNNLELLENVAEFNGPVTILSLDNKFNYPQAELRGTNSLEEKVELSDCNLDSETSQEIALAEPIRSSLLKRELSTESTANDSRSKLKIRTIEQYDKGYEIFSKYQLHKQKKVKTVNNSNNKSMENELPSEDEQLSSLKESSKDCDLSQGESQRWNSSLDCKHSVSTFILNREDFDNSMNDKLPLEDEEQLEDHKDIDDKLTIDSDAQSLESPESTKESDSSKIQPQRSNKSLISKASAPSLKSMPIKRQFSSSDKDHCSLENTPPSRKLPRLHKQSTNIQLELPSHDRESQKTDSYKSQLPKNKNYSSIKDKEELNTHKSVPRKQKKKPRPHNLEEIVATEALTQDTTKPYFRIKDFDEDDEIWIMEVPKTLDPKDLEDQVISLGGKHELRFGDDCYKVSSKPSKEICNVSCIFATNRRKRQYKIVNIESKGKIKFRQKFAVIPETELISSKVGRVPFPKNLKTRHPLFGAAYNDKI